MLSRLFKIIIDIVIVLCVASVLALVIPPLVGITTVISKPDMDSNYSEGSVAYGTRVAISTLNVDDEIIYSGDNYAYIYSVDSVDTDLSNVGVTDNTTNESGVIEISKNAVKKAVVIPMIGYIMIAMETTTGKAMLIGAAAMLIMLFITAEILNRDRKNAKRSAIEKKWDDENKEDEYFAALAQSMEKPIDESKFTSSKPSPSVSANTETTIGSETKVITKPLRSSRMDEFILEPNENTVPTKIVDGKKPDSLVSDIDNQNVDVMLKELRGEGSDSAANHSSVNTDAIHAEETDKAATKSVKKEEVPDERKEKIAAVASDKEEKQSENRFERSRKHREKAREEGSDESTAADESYKYIPPANSNAYNTDNIAAAFNEIPDEDSPASHNLTESEIPDVSAALVAALSTTQVSRSERTFQPQKQDEAEPSDEDASEIELAIPVKTAEEIIDAAYAQGYDPAVTTDDVTGVKIIDFSDCLI